MVTNVINIRWEGKVLIVERNGEETRYENAYVKDYVAPKAGVVAWPSKVKLSEIKAGIEDQRKKRDL